MKNLKKNWKKRPVNKQKKETGGDNCDGKSAVTKIAALYFILTR